MTKYRKLPNEIDAIKVSVALQQATDEWKELPDWLQEAYKNGRIMFGVNVIGISTLEGMITASYDDWIIRGIEGELYPCKPGIFAATYEAVT